MKVQAVIFDLDGTLTRPMLDFDLIRAEMGLGSRSVGILEAMEQMPEDKRRQAQTILDRHEQLAAIQSELNDGVHDLFEHLRRRQIAIGLLTRNTRQNALHVAAQHNLTFDAVVDRCDGPAKPDGFGVLKLCDVFGVRPDQTLVVGDFLHDLVAARNAGAPAVLMRTHPRAAEFEHLANYSIDQLGELVLLIQQLTDNSKELS
jgi:HAD superfamily hydrolase (TIGR01509 family)